MLIEKCENCSRKEFRRWDPDKWWTLFYQTPKESLDLLQCSHCGRVYQFSWVQTLVFYILFTLLVAAAYCLKQIPFVGFLFFLGIIFLLYPVVFEIPRRYFPWKTTDNDLFYVRWKSIAGLVLAHILGYYSGAILFAVLHVIW